MKVLAPFLATLAIFVAVDTALGATITAAAAVVGYLVASRF